MPRLDIGAIRRQQIVQAVRGIIATEGLDAVTIARIAAVSDISQGVITYHFENKQQILHDTLRQAMQIAGRRVETEHAADLPEFVSVISGLGQSDDDWWAVYIAFAAKALTDDFYRSELAWSDDRHRRALARYVVGDPASTLLLALIKGLALQQFVNPDVATDDVELELRKLFDAWLGNVAADRPDEGPSG